MAATDTKIVCSTPLLGEAAGAMHLSLEFGSYGTALVATDFAFFDLAQMSVAAKDLAPGGSAYDQEIPIVLTFGDGQSIANLGLDRVRFAGEYASDLCTRTGDAPFALTCVKPPFDGSAKAISGEVSLEYSPNDQCYVHIASYVLYNAELYRIVPTGAPSEQNFTLMIDSVGCPDPLLPGAHCRFVDTLSGQERVTPMAMRSSTELECASPAAGVAADYTVFASCNGTQLCRPNRAA